MEPMLGMTEPDERILAALTGTTPIGVVAANVALPVVGDHLGAVAFAAHHQRIVSERHYEAVAEICRIAMDVAEAHDPDRLDRLIMLRPPDLVDYYMHRDGVLARSNEVSYVAEYRLPTVFSWLGPLPYPADVLPDGWVAYNLTPGDREGIEL